MVQAGGGGGGGAGGSAAGGAPGGPDLGADAPDVPGDVGPGDPDGGDAEDMGPAPLGNGHSCGQDDQCASGVCAQGTCCATTCSGPCVACNLPTTEGTCQPVPAGEDPKEACTAELPATCGQDGTCDGQGACRRYPLNAECAAGGCSNGSERAASTCDGNGVCRPGSSTACPSGTCSGNTCGAPCSATVACQSGFYCDGSGRCALKRALANTCGNDGECASGFCADGVCCNSRCGEICFACNIAGSGGTCKPAANMTDPGNDCPAEAPSTCGRAGGCNGSGACRLYPSGTQCSGTSCTGQVQTDARTCDGFGTCKPPASSRSCAPYLCVANACPTSCASSGTCQPGFSCQGPVCSASNGLALLWRFEENSGTSAADSSGNSRTGTYVGDIGAPVPSTNLPPSSYPNNLSRAFTLENRHAVWMDPLPPAMKPANDFTLALWYRATVVDLSSGGSPIGSELVSAGNSYLLRLRALSNSLPVKQVEFSKRIGNGTFISVFGDTPNFLDGKWHHVAGVASKTNGMRLYFDGVEVGNSVNQFDDVVYSTTAHSFWVGRHGDGQSQWDFSGNIDEVRVYTRPLSAAEIATLAQGQNN
jgi:hypothetical protein